MVTFNVILLIGHFYGFKANSMTDEKPL